MGIACYAGGLGQAAPGAASAGKRHCRLRRLRRRPRETCARRSALSERSGVAAAPMGRGYPAAAVSALSSKVPATPAIGNGPTTSRDRADTGRRDPAAAHASALQGREQGESRRTVAAHSRAAVRRARILTDAVGRDLQRRAEREHATPLQVGSCAPHRRPANASPLGRGGDGNGEAVCRNRPACEPVRHGRAAAGTVPGLVRTGKGLRSRSGGAVPFDRRSPRSRPAVAMACARGIYHCIAPRSITP